MARVRRLRARIAALTPGDASGRLGLGVFALALFGVFSIQFGSQYYGTSNLAQIALAMSSVAIAVTGTMALLISGNVDLSIGSMFALDAILVGEVASHTHSTLLAILTGLVIGAALGGLNGLLVRALQLSPLIVTIATLALFGGVALAITNGQTVFGFPHSFVAIGQNTVGGVPLPAIAAAVIFVVGAFLLVRTRGGLRLYAIGGNRASAELAGIAVGRTVVGLYALNGALIGVVAILAAAQLASADPTLGTNFEFDVLTAAILGGVAFAGGGGRPVGVFFGIAMIGVVNAGLVFEGWQSYWQQVIQGGLLLVALTADQVLQPRLSARARRGSPAVGASVRDGATGGANGSAPLPEARMPRPARPACGDAILEARGLSKRYGPISALEGVDLDLHAGEVLCLTGDNGAGKSTLIKILSGAMPASSGEIRVDGQPLQVDSPRAAHAAGVRTVFQHLALCPNLSVTHNMVLGDECVKRIAGVLPIRDDGRAAQLTADRLAALSIKLPDYNVPVGRLSGGQQQSVAIARAMDSNANIVILDEPTAALGVAQTEHVLDLIAQVAAGGAGVILISHDIDTIMSVADTVVVLRLGSVVHRGPVGELDATDLMHLMSGRLTPALAQVPGVAAPSR